MVNNVMMETPKTETVVTRSVKANVEMVFLMVGKSVIMENGTPIPAQMLVVQPVPKQNVAMASLTALKSVTVVLTTPFQPINADQTAKSHIVVTELLILCMENNVILESATLTLLLMDALQPVFPINADKLSAMLMSISANCSLLNVMLVITHMLVQQPCLLAQVMFSGSSLIKLGISPQVS
jgi:hypothetical protein